jgi:hypothetical protein
MRFCVMNFEMDKENEELSEITSEIFKLPHF